MLESLNDSKREAFRAAIERAQEDGLSLDDMASMITAAGTEHFNSNGSVHPTEPSDVIYEPGELPGGLIDLPSAAQKYGIPNATLRSWVRLGKLPKCGRVRAKAPGGGYILTREDLIEWVRDNPRKPWHNKSATS